MKTLVIGGNKVVTLPTVGRDWSGLLYPASAILCALGILVAWHGTLMWLPSAVAILVCSEQLFIHARSVENGHHDLSDLESSDVAHVMRYWRNYEPSFRSAGWRGAATGRHGSHVVALLARHGLLVWWPVNGGRGGWMRLAWTRPCSSAVSWPRCRCRYPTGRSGARG